MTLDLEWCESSDQSELTEEITDVVANALAEGIKRHGMATLLVSGGSTPLPMFLELSARDIDWSNVVVSLADERWVPANDNDSNAKLVRENLLIKRASVARFVSLYRDGNKEQAIEDVRQDVASLPSPYSVVILGMGGDGHTASLFPDAPELEQAMSSDKLVEFLNPPSVGQTRISLTPAALLNTDNLLVHITGKEKRRVLESASELPIGRVLQGLGKPTKVYWAP